MKYLPILGELFSSDSAIFMLIGLVIATIIGIKMKNTRKNIIGVAICLVTYVVCEIVSNIIGMNYLVEIIALFVGTIAIGGFIGFIIGFIVSKVRKPIAMGSLTKEEIEKKALEVENVKSFIEGKEIVKTIVVPNKIVNFVIK